MKQRSIQRTMRQVEEAISDMFNDTTVDKRTTLGNLRAVIDNCEILCTLLLAEIKREELARNKESR